MIAKKPKTANERKKDRAELERRFLSSVIAGAEEKDIREEVARYGISWRSFNDKKHRVIWRALQTIDLRSAEERSEIIMDETMDVDAGEEGSAAWREYFKKLEELRRPLRWLERELEAAGVLPSCGGKKYLREMADVWKESVDWEAATDASFKNGETWEVAEAKAKAQCTQRLAVQLRFN